VVARDPGSSSSSEEEGDDDDRILTAKHAYFFRYSTLKAFLYWSLVLLTAGLLHIFMSFSPLLMARLRYASVNAAKDSLLAGNVDRSGW